MVENIIPLTNITLNAAAKTITLSAPYNTTTVEKVIKIMNLTKQSIIYDCNYPLDRTISITNGVITYTDSGPFANTDKLQIIIDSAISSSSSSVPVLDTLVTVFDAQAFPKSPDEGYTASGAVIDVTTCNKLSIACSNATSTNMSIAVYGLNTSTGTMLIPLQTITLNATTTLTGGVVITNLPPYVKITVTNLDTVNAGTVSATAQKFR